MMKVFIKTVFVFSALFCCFTIKGQTPTQLHLPAIFSDHIVLQQQSRVPIWGWAGA